MNRKSRVLALAGLLACPAALGAAQHVEPSRAAAVSDQPIVPPPPLTPAPARPIAPPQAAPAVQDRPATPEAFHAEVVRIYSMSHEALQDRNGLPGQSHVLDTFWNLVRADRPTYLPMLRAELSRTDNPEAFYFDGAELLRDVSQDRSDLQFALGIIESRPRFQAGNYLIAVSWYANHGFDTRRAAFRFLERADDPIYVSTSFHFFEYRVVEAMIFSLFPMEEQNFVGDLIARLPTAHTDMQLYALLHCIWATATPEGRAALAAYADDRSNRSAARTYAREMLSHEIDGPLPKASEAELRAARREVLRLPFQHESFERFHAITDQLVRVLAHPAPAAP